MLKIVVVALILASCIMLQGRSLKLCNLSNKQLFIELEKDKSFQLSSCDHAMSTISIEISKDKEKKVDYIPLVYKSETTQKKSSLIFVPHWVQEINFVNCYNNNQNCVVPSFYPIYTATVKNTGTMPLYFACACQEKFLSDDAIIWNCLKPGEEKVISMMQFISHFISNYRHSIWHNSEPYTLGQCAQHYFFKDPYKLALFSPECTTIAFCDQGPLIASTSSEEKQIYSLLQDLMRSCRQNFDEALLQLLVLK